MPGVLLLNRQAGDERFDIGLCRICSVFFLACFNKKNACTIDEFVLDHPLFKITVYTTVQ